MPASPHPFPALQLGEPVVARGIAIAPLFPRRDPVADYLTLDEALAAGLRVREVGDGEVPEVLVTNPTGRAVLIHDGEELAGAKQDRILNVSVLVAAGAELTVPVSCVERGRWSARSAAFAAAAHAAGPRLRRRKAERLRAAPLARGVAQGDVWDEVEATSRRLAVGSPTGAQRDAFAARRPAIDDLAAAFPAVPGQCGAALAIGGRAVCLDAVSRPAAFARLFPKLLRGYLLEAGAAPDAGGPAAGRPDPGPAAALLRAVAGAEVRRGPSPGLGRDLRLDGPGVTGSGLELDGELIQLSAYAVAG